MSKRRTLIINYGGLRMGGIEKAFANLMEYSLKQGYRVIWVTSKKECEKAVFKNISENRNVEKMFLNRICWSIPSKISFDKDENIIMLSCEPLMYMRGEQVRKKWEVNSFNHFLVLPHFTGNAYYPERFFSKTIVYKKAKNYFLNLIKKINDNNGIYAFSELHLTKYEENYGIVVKDKANKIFKGTIPIESIDIKKIELKAKQRGDLFTIVSCSRLDFPHKGYILGLVDEFEKIKNRYEQCQLIIVGDGPGKETLEKKIGGLPKEIRNAIKMTGTLLPNKLDEVLSVSHLSVGLSGALSTSAKKGVPSLNVRHYTNECETYGYIGDLEGNGLRTDKGDEIFKYVQNLILCSEQEYIGRCQKDYNYIAKKYEFDPEFFFKQRNCDLNSFSKKDLCIAGLLWYVVEVLRHVFRIPGYEM